MIDYDILSNKIADLAVSVGDSTKLRTATGWSPELPLAQTLQDTLDWWRVQA
jgi:GDP-4-dehydro-6-deoxy-D-mannose reductase